MATEVLHERGAVLEAERARDPIAIDAGLGQEVGLDAGRGLDDVLGASKREVGGGDLAELTVADEALGAQPAEPVEGATDAEPCLTPAPDELEGLDEELGLADAAGRELDIARRVDRELRPGSPREPDHLERDPRIDGSPPNEGLERGEDLAPEGEIAGDGSGSQERRALPEPPEGLVVALGRRERVDDRTAPSFGPEAKIDPENEAVLGHVVERRGHPLRDARPEVVEGDLGPVVGPRRALVGVVEIKEIDVAPGVQLVAAELAHPEHREAHAFARRGARHAEASRGREERLVEGRLDHDVGERRELGSRDVDVGAAGRWRQELAEGDADLLLGRDLAELAPDAGRVVQAADPREDAARVRAGRSRGGRVPVARDRAGDFGRRPERSGERRVRGAEHGRDAQGRLPERPAPKASR